MPVASRAPFKPLLLTAMCLSTVNAVPAHAGVLTSTQYFTGSTLSLSVFSGPGSDSENFSFSVLNPLVFAKFDPILGTLTQVAITLTSNVSGFVSVAANVTSSTGSVDASADLEIDLAVNIPGVPSFTFDQTRTADCQIPAGSPGNCNDQSSFGAAAFNGSFVSGLPGDLANFTGLANFGVNLVGTAGLDLTCDITGFPSPTCSANASGVSWASNTFTTPINGRGLVSVTYTYVEPAVVPEPTSLALLCLGLAGLGLRRRRQAARSA